MSLLVVSHAAVLAGALSGAPGHDAPARAVPGRPAPEFALKGTEGREHRLSDLKGRIVVLEWTCYLCPAVNGHQDSRSIPDTRSALGGDVAWLTIDSSWFCEHQVDAIRAWRQRRDPTVPYLLDSTGRIGRLYGAQSTPQLFVIDAAGVLRYGGALTSRRPGMPESDVRNYVIEAVEAIRRGRAVAPPETRAPGCSIAYGDAAEDRGAHAVAARLFELAAEYAAEGEADHSLQFIESALRAGYPAPCDVLKDARFRPVRDGSARGALKQVLRQHASESSITLIDAREPGEPLIVTGTVRDSGGRPVAGALVYVFHTDRRGLYSGDGVARRTRASASTMDESDARLFGYLRTGPDGRFEYRTIRPGHYPVDPSPAPDEGRGAEGVEQHVHYELEAAGFAPRIHRLGFADDPFWTRTGLAPPRWAAEVSRGPDGVDRCEHEIGLQPHEPPNMGE